MTEYSIENAPFSFQRTPKISCLEDSIEKIYKRKLIILDKTIHNDGFYQVHAYSMIQPKSYEPIVGGSVSQLSCGHYVHELLHLLRFGMEIPFWLPYPTQDEFFIEMDDFIEHFWIYQNSVKFLPEFNPYQDNLTRSLSNLENNIKDILKLIETLEQPDLSIYKIRNALLLSDLFLNCAHLHDFSDDLKYINENLPEISMIIETVKDHMDMTGINLPQNKFDLFSKLKDFLKTDYYEILIWGSRYGKFIPEKGYKISNF